MISQLGVALVQRHHRLSQRIDQRLQLVHALVGSSRVVPRARGRTGSGGKKEEKRKKQRKHLQQEPPSEKVRADTLMA